MPNRTFADISDYQPRFDAGRYAAGGHLLVAIKATEGTDWTSATHAQRAAAAHGRGVNVWHYHFAHPDTNPNEDGEARHFWQHVQPHFHPGDRLVLDIELHHPDGSRGLVAYTRKLDSRLHNISGQAAILYTYRSLLAETGRVWAVISGDYWIADYGGRIWSLGFGRRLLAQQTTDGTVGYGPKRFAGIGQCDGDILNWWFYRRLLRERRRRRKPRK